MADTIAEYDICIELVSILTENSHFSSTQIICAKSLCFVLLHWCTAVIQFRHVWSDGSEQDKEGTKQHQSIWGT